MTKKEKTLAESGAEITVENCEQAAIEALQQYQKKNMMADFWFWRLVLPKLKQKWQGKVEVKA